MPASVTPPVLKQPLRSGRVVGDLEPSAARGVGEVGLGIATAQPGKRVSFDRVVLATVVEGLERAEPFAQGGVEAAGANRGAAEPGRT